VTASEPPPLADPSPAERVLWVVLTAAFLLGAAGDRVPLLRGPAPYPPEWQWPLRESPVAGSVVPAVAAVLAMAALLALSATSWAASRPHAARRVLLAGAAVLGLALPIALAALEPGGPGPAIFGRVAYRTATSYYTVALSPDADDPLAFVRRHHELLPALRKGTKHAATHPPGPVLVYRGLLGLAERSPVLTRAVLSLAGIPEANPRRPRPEHLAPARAAGMMGALLILLAGVLTAWPLAALAGRLGSGPLPAARLAALWTLLPGPVLMLPQFDQALALPVTLSALALARALEATRGAALWAAGAGLAGGAALALSYGAPAFLAIGGAAVLAAALARGAALSAALRPCAIAAGVTAATFAAPALLGHHPIASALTALEIHREFFTAPRAYALWLLFDPLDLAVFVGLPVAGSLALGAVRAVRRLAARVRPRPEEAFRLGALAALLLLLLSGQTRGEVGRIWIPIMPVLLVAALARPASPEREEGPSAGSALLLAALIAPATIAIALWWRFF
jgi:hypothetical protein